MAYKRKFSKRTFKSKRAPIRRKPTRKFSKKRSFASRVKSIVLKSSESKNVNFDHGKVELYHNQLDAKGLSTYANSHPPLGTNDHQRIGDKIYTGGYMLRMLIGQKVDRPNVSFRWAVLEVPRGATYAYNNWFENTTGNTQLDGWNKDYVKVLKSGHMRPNQAALATSGDREYTFIKKIWVPYRKPYVYGPSDGAQTLAANPPRDLYFVIAPYDAYGSLGTDNVAYVQLMQTLYYKDI